MASLFGAQLAASDVMSDVIRVITRETPRPGALSMREVPAPTGGPSLSPAASWRVCNPAKTALNGLPARPRRRRFAGPRCSLRRRQPLCYGWPVSSSTRMRGSSVATACWGIAARGAFVVWTCSSAASPLCIVAALSGPAPGDPAQPDLLARRVARRSCPPSLAAGRAERPRRRAA